MVKEEEQVFPLLMQQFSPKEQASLVWQFMCNVPVTLLEDFLPWMASFLSPDEQINALHCLKEVVPKEKLLQEVVISWIDNKNQPSFGAFTNTGKGVQCPDGPANLKDIFDAYTSRSVCLDKWQWRKESSIQTTVRRNPVDGLHLWHGAIRKDLKRNLEELYQIRSSNNISTLPSVVIQLKFFADVLIFYRNALDKIFYPMSNELVKVCPSPSFEQFPVESQIESLQRLLYSKVQNGIPTFNFMEKLCGELELFFMGISKQMVFLETEVFPIFSKNCSHEMQRWLLYTSLLMMPLGLLKCAITWFSAHLTEDESKSILYCIKQGGPLVNRYLASLLYEWVRIGYSGKTSTEKFRRDLQKMFNSRTSFLSEHIKEDSGVSCLQLGMQSCSKPNPGSLEPKSDVQGKNCMFNSSSSGSNTTDQYDTSYSSGINLHILLPRTLKKLSPYPKFPADNSGVNSIFTLEPKPMDHIFFFHKALKKDLEYLVFVSAKLAENAGLYVDFHRRFNLVRSLYQIHSDSEDEIAFPALEAKGKAQNISHSYSIDHKLEVEHFNKISLILDEISKLHVSDSIIDVDKWDKKMLKFCSLCVELHSMCKSMHNILCEHVHREEIELWPLFRECFSLDEQEKIIGSILGRTRAEVLQEMIPWLMESLSPEEQNAIMSLWRKATKNTMFHEWLGEWWEGMKRYEYDIVKVEEESNIPPSWIADPLEVILKYLPKENFNGQGGILRDNGVKFPRKGSPSSFTELHGNLSVDDKEKTLNGNQNNYKCSDYTVFSGEVGKKRSNEIEDATDQVSKPDKLVQVSKNFRNQEHLLSLNQEELEAAIRRVSRDTTLDPQKRSYIIQNLLMSRWIVRQQKSHSEVTVSSNKEEVPGQCPSYRGPLKSSFGCKHYKRNCKLVAACCNQLYTCRYCHDDVADHSMDRKATTKMMCMKCLTIQPVGPTCSTASCHDLSMARYYCRICKLFDDEREIYHCPYCNLCRVGKGLGIDYFHCMNCNACMSRSLAVHTCREKCFEDNCPICHEYIFTSSSPVKALACGHLMHSACFQDYTYTHYTCPICSKSLGDMQVYFGMLDALLAEEKIPDDYSGQTQVILCNDCEKRGTASFHWLYHKCSYCGSYNTRLL
ncbi:zinc finger protein BRUTUS-like At1g74770 isoform X2 [Cornus florida]|nr:zinc finger protein BRUTUS-like At1g74770 isoform X2 [Cornus florida]